MFAVLTTTAQADARVSLFLNNGSQSNPTAVVLLSPEMLGEQLNRACQAFVDHTVKVKAATVEEFVPCGIECRSCLSYGYISGSWRSILGYIAVRSLMQNECALEGRVA